MAAKTVTAPALELSDLRDINAHPLVAPIWEERCALGNRQRAAQEALDQQRAILITSDKDSSIYRLALKRFNAAQGELDEAQEALRATNAPLEAAKSEARLELRSLANEEAIPALEALEQALVQLENAQLVLLDVDTKLRRLGAGPSMARLADAAVPARLRMVQDTLKKLRR